MNSDDNNNNNNNAKNYDDGDDDDNDGYDVLRVHYRCECLVNYFFFVFLDFATIPAGISPTPR